MKETLKVKLSDEQVAYIIYKVTEKMMLDANRIEVVRCKDCKHRDKCHKKISIREYDKDIECNYARFERLDYCSYGERK